MAQDDFQAFVERIKQAESRGQRFDKKGNLLTSPKGAQGEMQVMPATQRAPGFGITPVRDDSPDEKARVGRELLQALDSYYGGNKMYAAAAYNWGKSRVDRWIAQGADFDKLPKETQGYLMRVTPDMVASSKRAPAPAPSEPSPVMEPPLGISASAAPAAPARSASPATAAAVPAATAEDLGSGYKAALALAFLGEEDKDREATDDELRDRLDRQEEEASAQALAEYKPVNALKDLEITALNPIKALRPAQPVEPVRMAAGGVPYNPVARITPSARAQLESIKADYDRYNAAVPEFNAALQKYQTEVYQPYEQAVNQYNAAVEAYNAGPREADFTGTAPTAPAEFSMAAPVAPSVTQAQYDQMAADARKSAARRQLALVVASDPSRFNIAMNKFFAEGGEVDSLDVSSALPRTSEAKQQLSVFDRLKEQVKTRAQEMMQDPYGEFVGKYIDRKGAFGNHPMWFAPEMGYLMYKQATGEAPAESMLNRARKIIRGPNPSKGLEPIERADGGEVDSSEVMPSMGNEQIGNTAPPRYSAREMEAYLRTANPRSTVLEYARGMGGAMGFVNSRMPDVINVQRTLTPGTKEQTLLHELEHSMDMKGGDIFGRPEIARMDNNYRAYHLMNNDWRPIEKFVDSVIQNKDKLSNFFGQDIVSGYLTVDPETFKKMKSRGMVRGLFSEQIASLSALEQATGKSLTRDPEMRKIFPNTQMMAVYDALTGLRQTRTDARDLPPHTPLPSYMYETNPVTRFIREKTTGKNEYGIPIKRSNGGEAEPTPEEIAAASRPATFNPKIARQGAAARALAAQRDVNTLPDPRTYAAVSGFLGQAPDELGFSAMHPDLQGITKAGEAGFVAGTLAGVAPVVAPVARAVGKAATAAGMRAEKALEAPVTRTLERGGRSAEMLQAFAGQPAYVAPPSKAIFQHIPTSQAPFVGRLDEFVANLPGPVQKDQFLGQLRGKFREYDIKRAEETLADLPGNAKLAPTELLNRIKSKYDPSSFKTTVIPPKGPGEFYESADNPYFSSTDPDAGMLGVIHLSQHASTDMATKAKAAYDLDKSFDRLSGKITLFIDSDIENINKVLAEAAQGTTVPLSETTRNVLVDFINKNNNLLSGASDIYEVEKRVRFPAAEPHYFSRMYKRAQELTGNKIPSDSALQKANAEAMEQYFDGANQLLIKHGYEPLPKPNFKEMSRPASWMDEDRKTYDVLVAKIKDIKDSFKTRMKALRPEAEQVGNIVRKDLQMTVPYKDQHPALMAPVDPISFSRYSEHVADVPGMGKLEGIYVNELQSDRLDDIRKFGKRGGSSQADEKLLDEIDNKLAEKFNKRYQAEAQNSTEAVARLNDEIDGLSYRRARISKRIREGEYIIPESFANMENLPQVAQQLMAKNAIMGAIQERKQFVAFPGKESAQSQLYEKLPRNLKDVVKDLGPGFELREITLTNPDGLNMMHNAIVWSPEAAARIQKKGVPFKSGGMVERTYNDNRAYL